MAKLLAAAISRLAWRFDGQVLLEVPDELDAGLLEEIVAVSNAQFESMVPFSWLLFDRRTELERRKPSCGFRELAELREDRRLVVCYASDNRGMSTYTSVFAALFGPEFPSTANSEFVTRGIANLSDLSGELARCIKEEIGDGPRLEEICAVTSEILEHLAASYRKEGNTASSWVSNWWLHVASWADEFVDAVREVRKDGPGVEVLALMYGAAGLPSPDSGPVYTMKAMRGEYLDVIRDRWSSAAAIDEELARLERDPLAEAAAKHLHRIPWKGELAGGLSGAGSLLRAASGAGRENARRERFLGWARLPETAFLSRLSKTDELELLRDGQALPAPWPGASMLRILKAEVRSTGPIGVCLQGITLGIPFADPESPLQEMPPVATLAKHLRLGVTPGDVIGLEIVGGRLTPAGLEVDLSASIQVPKWSTKATRFSLSISGELARHFGDEASTRAFLVPPDGVLALCRRSGSTGRGGRTQSGLSWIQQLGTDAPVIELDRGGLYQVALGFGDSAIQHASSARIDPQRSESGLKVMEGVNWLLAAGPSPLVSDDAIECHAGRLVAFEAGALVERPLSPLIAACAGSRPSVNNRNELETKCFGILERRIMEALRGIESGDPGISLGHVLLTASETKYDVAFAPGGYFASRALDLPEPQKYPAPPSPALRALPEYAALAQAYKELGLCGWVDRVEEEENCQGLLLSRISLREIEQHKIDALLTSYSKLVAAADSLSSGSDGFWARFPMSIVVYPESRAQTNCEAVFLSPAHPVRLAWLWQLENAFAVVREEADEPPSYARLTEGWTFPWASGLLDRLGQGATPLVSVPCDIGPEQVFAGWSVLARLSPSEAQDLRPPRVVNGARFPAGASSGLTESAVEGALRDFVRVFPQVRTVVVELPAFADVQRSSNVDEALGTAFQRLTAGEDARWCLPGGMRVRDSIMRKGPVPSRDEFVQREQRVIGYRKIEWERFDPNDRGAERGRVHIRLVESQSSQLQAAALGRKRAAFPRLPLRRFPRRVRLEGGILIDPSFQDLPIDNPFASAVAACESIPGQASLALHVSPGTHFGDIESADWTVTGDAGLDPALLQKIAVADRTRHMLWEWRPAVANRGQLQLEQRPFVTISRVPEAFSSSLREKVSLVLPVGEQDRIADRVDAVVRVLAQRGVGLNSLLAMGHHHSTGALGFYFAICLLGQWASGRKANDVRLIVPVDAVDPFLRSIASQAQGAVDTSKLADLLVLSCIEHEGRSVIRVVPVEIKHYGLTAGESDSQFPGPEEQRIDNHVKQLGDYSKLVGNIQLLKEKSSETHVSLIDTAIGAVVDAAILLDPQLQCGDDPVVMRNIAAGHFDFQLCPGVLLWFQKGGGAAAGRAAADWNEFKEHQTPHAKVFVDPLGCWKEVWLDERGEACSVVADSLAWCLEYAQVEAERSRKKLQAPGVEISRGQARAVETRNAGAESTPAGANGRSGLQVPGQAASTQLAVQPVPPVPPPSFPKEPPVSRTSEQVGSVATHAPARPEIALTRKGLPQDELERRYNMILRTFNEFKVKVHPPEVASDRITEGPSSILFGVKPGFGVAVQKIQSQVDNLKLRLQLDSNAVIGTRVHRGLVLLDVPKADSERYFVDAREMWTRWQRPGEGFSIPIGEDRYGNIVSMDWADSNSPHLLLAGQTGSGKSVALLAILMGAVHYYAPAELRLVLVDPKRVELSGFAGSPHLLTGTLLSEASEAAAALESAVIEMESRYGEFVGMGVGVTNLDMFNARAAPGKQKPRWLVVLDEYADLVHDPAAKTSIENSLKRLAQKARASGIHVLVSTQKPVVEVISTVVRGNLPAQLALRVKAAAESRVILDEGGAEALTGKGDALLKIGGEVTRLQCASYVPV